MARWVESRANEEGWRVRTRRQGRAEGSGCGSLRRLGRSSRLDGDRVRRTGGHRLHSSRCFRCLGSGHWSSACRDPIVCRRCGGSGHWSYTCTRGRRTEAREAEVNEVVSHIQLGDNFNPCDEMRSLRCCVVVKAVGWSPSEGEVAQEFGDLWGEKFWTVDKVLGAGTFIVKVTNPQLRSKMVRRGVMQSRRGSLQVEVWCPEFAATPSETVRWHLRLGGLPLHWQQETCVRTLLHGLGKITEFGRKGIDGRGVTFTELTMVTGTKQSWPQTIVAAYDREAYRIRVEARRTPMWSKMAWADLLRERPSEEHRSERAEASRGRQPLRRKRRLSRTSSSTRREPRRRESQSKVGGDEVQRGRVSVCRGRVASTQGFQTASGPKLMSEIHVVTSAEKQ
ncbi:hypothetical protein QJS10_CPB13g01347 [Acorus calamus]|uniref:CCHC-type domain-containing protein n=1 Tax=Acorus calamus TaxID=4465 RepID=A0AAV9DFE5_ACOCL|nr:hypothetical protein QJS10_CPB13g01347 [Acorus calamus]